MISAVIYPTRRAIVLAAVGAPLALLIGLLAPGYWWTGGRPGWRWSLALVLADALLGPARRRAALTLAPPRPPWASAADGAGRACAAALRRGRRRAASSWRSRPTPA